MLAEKFLLTCDLSERKTNGLKLSSILKSDGCHRSLAEILSLLATYLLKHTRVYEDLINCISIKVIWVGPEYCELMSV